jgi:hypothetical protein
VDALLRALGLSDDESVADELEVGAEPAGDGAGATVDAAAARRAVLERLARREIDPATAAAELRALGG